MALDVRREGISKYFSIFVAVEKRRFINIDCLFGYKTVCEKRHGDTNWIVQDLFFFLIILQVRWSMSELSIFISEKADTHAVQRGFRIESTIHSEDRWFDKAGTR